MPQTNNITIRPSNAADFLAVHQVDLHGWANIKETNYLPDGEHTWRIWCEHALCYVAITNDEVVGFILAFPTTTDRLYCFHKIVVREDMRGKRVGGMLLRRLTEEMDTRKLRCFLTVAPYNAPAIALYSSLGFKKSEYVAGYYRANEDRHIMVYGT